MSMRHMVAVIGMRTIGLREIILAELGSTFAGAVIVADRTPPELNPVEVLQQITLKNFDLPKFEKELPFRDEAPKRVPHWQRHNRTPFYATAPRGKRRK